MSCRSGIFGYLYMNEIMVVRTVLPFWYKHIKEVPTAMAVSFMTLWSLWALLYACTVSEIGFCVSWEDSWLLFVRLQKLTKKKPLEKCRIRHWSCTVLSHHGLRIRIFSSAFSRQKPILGFCGKIII